MLPIIRWEHIGVNYFRSEHLQWNKCDVCIRDLLLKLRQYCSQWKYTQPIYYKMHTLYIVFAHKCTWGYPQKLMWHFLSGSGNMKQTHMHRLRGMRWVASAWLIVHLLSQTLLGHDPLVGKKLPNKGLPTVHYFDQCRPNAIHRTHAYTHAPFSSFPPPCCSASPSRQDRGVESI